MNKPFKPMLACNASLPLPCAQYIVQPKIDGVRGLVIDGQLVGRSLKPFKNKFINRILSNHDYDGLDFEIVARAFDTTSPDLCRITTSALNSIEGDFDFAIYIFDCFKRPELGYCQRIGSIPTTIDCIDEETESRVQLINLAGCYPTVKNQDYVADFVESYAAQGYEGTIVRDPYAPYKFGRATAREGSFLKIKPYIDFNLVITSVEEAMTNENEATINELGHTSRSTHQENLKPSGKIGAMWGELLEDVQTAHKLFKRGELVKIGAGCLTHDQREAMFSDQSLIVGKVAVAKCFSYGCKDKLRHPTFKNFRASEDISD